MWAAYQITTSVEWALELSWPSPFKPFIVRGSLFRALAPQSHDRHRVAQTVVSTITEFTFSQVLPVKCVTVYDFHRRVTATLSRRLNGDNAAWNRHLLVSTIVPFTLIIVPLAFNSSDASELMPAMHLATFERII